MSRPRLTPINAAAALCALGFLVTGGLALRDVARSAREDAANRALASQVRQFDEAAGPEAEPYTQEGELRRYQELHRQNGDMAGWLSVPDTRLDCPVMYTPDEPEKYLRRAFDGSYALSGSLFLGEGCTPEGNHLIVYGHNMKDGTMFGSLTAFGEADYARDHAVTLDTLRREGTFAVVGAFYCQAEEGDFPYYRYTSFADEAEQAEYIARVLERSLYDSGVRPAWGDRVLTLSTCSYIGDAGRFVVVAAEQRG